jgi:FMN phosphatase YigB (HAD superfamily)/carbamoylphosphate synthase large subunit
LTPVLTVVVVSGGGFQGLGLVQALRESPRVRIVLADCHAENVTRYFVDAAHVVPEIARGEEFLAALLGICAAEDAQLVFPATAYELRTLAAARTRFRERGVAVAVSDPAFLDVVEDKRRLYPRLAEAGLPVLAPIDPRTAEPAFPLIAKPAGGWGGRGVAILRSREDLAARREILESHVLQPYLEGADELSADFAIDLEGAPSAIGLRRRVRTSGGFAVVSETVEHPEARAAVSSLVELARGLGARGVLNVQLLTRGGEVYLSDVNPRFGTSATHWCGTGFNPALHVCASVLPGLEAKKPARVHVRSVRHLEDLRVEPEPSGPRGAIRGVVFDLDDTLIPHKDWIVAKLELVHQARASELPAREVFLRGGLRLLEEGQTWQLFDALAAHFGLADAAKDALVAAYRAVEPPACAVFPDVLPSLVTLRRRGLKLGVLTDNPPASQRAKIERSPIPSLVDVVVYARESGADKPDGRGFADVASRLGLPPAALAMVGDNPHRDLAGAAAAGFGRLFLVRRPGTLFSFDADLFRALPGSPRELTELTSLAPLPRLLGWARARP